MKKIKMLISLFMCFHTFQNSFCQTDTISVESFTQAMDYVYGALDTTQLTTDVFINRSPADSTFFYFDGKKDSAIYYAQFLLHYNSIQLSKRNCKSNNPFIVIDSIARSKPFVPLGLSYFSFDKISASSFTSGNLSFENGHFTNSVSTFNPFEQGVFFAACPMSFSCSLTTDFQLDSDFIFTNKNLNGCSFFVNFNDGLGLRPIAFNQNYSIQLDYGWNTIALYLITPNDTLKAKSKIFVLNRDSLSSQNRLSGLCEYIEPDIPIQVLSADDNYGLIKEGNPTGRYAVWLGCGNDTNGAEENTLSDIRKPYIVSGGFNPLKGKALNKCSLNDLSEPDVVDLFVEFAIASSISALISATTSGLVNIPAFAELATFLYETDAYGGWRGPIYETYNGTYNKFFSTGGGETANTDNGTKYFEKLREEGYDIIIVTYDNPVDYLENNAAVLISLIKQMNRQLQLNGSKSELIVGGYSAGALTSRVALAEMERYYAVNKGTSNEAVYPHPHTRMFMSVEGEYQGANTPLGFQHVVDYLCNSLTTTPIEILEVILARLTRRQFSNHTAKELSIWHYEATINGVSANQNPERDSFVQLQNQLGFPSSCRKVGVSQGSAFALGYSAIDPNDHMFHIRSELQTGIYPLLTIGYYREYFGRYTPGSTLAALATRNEGISITSFGASIYLNLIGNYNNRTTYIQNCKPLDVCPGSLLAADRTFDNSGAQFLFGTLSFWSNPLANNSYYHQGTNHSFAPTVSGLDLHNPLNPSQEADLYFNLVANGLTKTHWNQGILIDSKNFDYGYPHLTYPSNHYAITPFDAIWAVGESEKGPNHFHVEDPQKEMSDFMVGEVAPEYLYLSNRSINELLPTYTYYNKNTGTTNSSTQYQAAYSARKSIFCGNDVYYIVSNQSDGNKVPTKELTPKGNFSIGANGDVEFTAGKEIYLLPGFESQSGSNFIAAIEPNPCSNEFELSRTASQNQNGNTPVTKEMIDLIPQEASAENARLTAAYKVYPNPAVESICIDGIQKQEILQIRMSDMNGKLVLQAEVANGSNTVDVSKLKAGTFLLVVEKCGNFIQSEKIILSEK